MKRCSSQGKSDRTHQRSTESGGVSFPMHLKGKSFRTPALLLCAAAAFASNHLQAQSITLSPGYTSIGVNQTLQYTATVTGLANTSLTWKVANITGGNSTYGTIVSTGAFTALYTAPATIPANGITVA